MSQIPPLVNDGPPRAFTPLSNHLIFPGQTLYITVVGSSMLGHLRVFSLPNVRVWAFLAALGCTHHLTGGASFCLRVLEKHRDVPTVTLSSDDCCVIGCRFSLAGLTHQAVASLLDSAPLCAHLR